MPARGWQRTRAFRQPMSMKPRSRSDESSVRMRWIPCSIPGPIFMRCTTARLSTVFRSTMSLTAARCRSIRVASIASFYCRCRSAGRAQVRTGGREIEVSAWRCGVAIVSDAADPNGLAGQLRATDLAGGSAAGRKQGCSACGKAGGPDRIRTAYRPRHTVRTGASIPDRISGRSRRAWRTGCGSAARDDGHLARVRSSGFFSPANATISATRSIGRRSTAKHCPRCSSGHGTALRPTPPSRSIWKNCRGRPASESGPCNWVSGAISGFLFRKRCWIFASSISTHGF